MAAASVPLRSAQDVHRSVCANRRPRIRKRLFAGPDFKERVRENVFIDRFVRRPACFRDRAHAGSRRETTAVAADRLHQQ